MSNNTGNTLLALLAGAAIGAVAGILMAPDKGSKTREKIKDGFDDAKKNLKSKINSATEGFRSKASNTQFDLEETYDDLVSSMSHKTEDVISFLETKLADLKKENAKLQK
ncbi:MAG: YtxH domain-containing protein [Flavobacterium sp.]|jgi:gas vesicle protein|nr:YtxH domain-containing protein [Flavobacterium sp.]